MTLKHFLSLLICISKAELKAREQDHVLGMFWTWIYPAAMFGVMFLIFSQTTGRHIDNFAFYLIIGLVHWDFFVRATTLSMNLLITRRDYLRNFVFPYEFLILAPITISCGVYLVQFFLLVGLALYFTSFSLSFWLIPLLPICFTMFIIGVSLFLSTLYLFLKDIEYVWSIALQLGIFVTPVFYSLDIVKGKAQMILAFNPLIYYLDFGRAILCYGQVPSLRTLLVVIAGSILTLSLGCWWFKKNAKRFPELM